MELVRVCPVSRDQRSHMFVFVSVRCNRLYYACTSLKIKLQRNCNETEGNDLSLKYFYKATLDTTFNFYLCRAKL